MAIITDVDCLLTCVEIKNEHIEGPPAVISNLLLKDLTKGSLTLNNIHNVYMA